MSVLKTVIYGAAMVIATAAALELSVHGHPFVQGLIIGAAATVALAVGIDTTHAPRRPRRR